MPTKTGDGPDNWKLGVTIVYLHIYFELLVRVKSYFTVNSYMYFPTARLIPGLCHAYKNCLWSRRLRVTPLHVYLSENMYFIAFRKAYLLFSRAEKVTGPSHSHKALQRYETSYMCSSKKHGAKYVIVGSCLPLVYCKYTKQYLVGLRA